MKNNNHCFVLTMSFFTILLTALFTPNFGRNAIAKIVDLNELKDLTCSGDARPESFSLLPLNEKPNPNDIWKRVPFSGNDPNVLQIQMALGQRNVRLDVCLSAANQATLKRIVYHDNDHSPLEAFTPDDALFVKVEGLSKAIFGDYSKLLLIAQEKGNPAEPEVAPQGLFLVGVPKANAASYAAVLRVQFEGEDKMQLTSIYALTGKFENGNAFKEGRCKMSETEMTHEFDLDSAHFTVLTCEFLGGGMTTGYTIQKLIVKDKSSQIASQMRGVAVTLEGDELQKRLQYKFNHHNGCDSFTLTIPKLNAVYAATTAPAAGCGEVVGKAPKRAANSDPNATFFQIFYKNQTSTLKKTSYKHYFGF